MAINIRAYSPADLPAMTEIWNTIVEEANAFPQDEPLSLNAAEAFFKAQSLSAVAVEPDETGQETLLGLYILHPNNIGRCGHIANSSYAVKAGLRGRKIGELLVRDSLVKARELDFTLLQFNAVVNTNIAAIRLYEKLGFHQLGTIPGGFRLADGSCEAIRLFYIEL